MRIGSIVQIVGPISGIDEYDQLFAAAEERLRKRGSGAKASGQYANGELEKLEVDLEAQV